MLTMLFHFAIMLLFIFIGVRVGGTGIAFAGGAGVLVLALFGVAPGALPLDVVSIILAIISAIAAMQVAGGMDYLVGMAEKLLRNNPRYLIFLAPLVNYFLTLAAGTGHTAYSTLPVITEVAKENNIRPMRPLSMAGIAALFAITASPISAAVVYFSSAVEEAHGVDYISLLAVLIPSTLIALLLTAGIMLVTDKARGIDKLDTSEDYQHRLAEGSVEPPHGMVERQYLPSAKPSLMVFLIGLLVIVAYSTLISPRVGLVEEPVMGRDMAIIAIPFTMALIIMVMSGIKSADILAAPTMRAGVNAALCIMGVAWLGNTFMTEHTERIESMAGDMLREHPWTLAVVLFVASLLMYSQAGTARALYPIAFAIGVSPLAAVAAFPAVAGMFVLPTGGVMLAAVNMDDTGTTKIGKFVFNHPFILPGIINLILSVALGFLFGSIIL